MEHYFNKDDLVRWICPNEDHLFDHVFTVSRVYKDGDLFLEGVDCKERGRLFQDHLDKIEHVHDFSHENEELDALFAEIQSAC